MHCHSCGSKLLRGAKFCHACGEKVVIQLEACSSCNTMNPAGAAYCITCGDDLKVQKATTQFEDAAEGEKAEKKGKKSRKKAQPPRYEPIYRIHFGTDSEIAEQVKTQFFQALRHCVNIISSDDKYSEYVETFYESGFNFYFSQYQRTLVKDLKAVPMLYPKAIEYHIDVLLDNAFENLLNRFTVLHTKALNTWQPPDVIRYENAKLSEVNLSRLIYDYLDVPQDNEKIYTNFLLMPTDKLKNACKSFLTAEKQETLLVISDQSVFGTNKEGFALTDESLYWKAYFNKPHKIRFEELYDLREEQSWLTINHTYFHIDKSMNFKMLKLLKKLRYMYRSTTQQANFN